MIYDTLTMLGIRFQYRLQFFASLQLILLLASAARFVFGLLGREYDGADGVHELWTGTNETSSLFPVVMVRPRFLLTFNERNFGTDACISGWVGVVGHHSCYSH